MPTQHHHHQTQQQEQNRREKMQANERNLFKDSQENISESKKSSLHSLSNNDLQEYHNQNTKSNPMERDSSFFDAISRIQSNRLEDQRCAIRGSNTEEENLINEENSSICNSITPNDEFFNLIMKSQRTRLEDQRTSMNSTKPKLGITSLKKNSNGVLIETNNQKKIVNNNLKPEFKQPSQPIIARKSITVPPDDEFFSMIQKIQSRRLDEQRSVIKSNPLSMKTSKSGSEVRKKTHLV